MKLRIEFPPGPDADRRQDFEKHCCKRSIRIIIWDISPWNISLKRTLLSKFLKVDRFTAGKWNKDTSCWIWRKLYHSLLSTEKCYSTACPENILSFSHYATPTHDLRVVGVWSRASAAQNTSSARVSQLITTQNTRPDQCRETLGDTVIGKRTSRKLGVGDRKCLEGLTRKWSIGKIQE